MLKVGVVGASGYGGAELLRLVHAHPSMTLQVAMAGGHAGEQVGHHTPSLAAAYPDLRYSPTEPGDLAGCDLVFLALPHGESQRLVPVITSSVGTIVDLAADYRLAKAELYPTWYGEPHASPDLLARFVYGLPEINRDQLVGATLIAAAGCYPTAATLALRPLVDAGVVETTTPLGVDAASGTSGAGRAAKDHLHFAAVDEDFSAYGLLNHRHTPEMEQAIGSPVLFTPHLAPMVRGILATCYGRMAGKVTTAEVLTILREYYADSPFVLVTDEPPSTKSTAGTNVARVSAQVDPRTGWVVALAALDNLVKGAAGQAIQCANLALGLDERAGLPIAGVFP